MTPVDIQTACKDIYNATGDSFFSALQINNWIWQGCNELAREARIIEATSSVSTVAGTQGYAYPTNAIGIIRVTLAGKKLKRINTRQDDALTLSNQASVQTGFSSYYFDFNSTIYLRTIPDAIYSLAYFYYKSPTAITDLSVLEVPLQYHFNLVDYCLYRMASKDKDYMGAQMYKGQWDQAVLAARAWKARMKRADSFATVQDEETLPVNIMGEV